MRLKKIQLVFAIILYLSFFLVVFLEKEVVVKAVHTSVNQEVQVDETANYSIEETAQSTENILKFLVSVILAGTLTCINIYKFWVERKYEIESVNIDLVNDREQNCIGCTELQHHKIYKNKKEIFARKFATPCYLDMSIKISIPNTRKKIKNIAIRNMSVYVNGYRIIYKGIGRGVCRVSKCKVDKQNDTVNLLLKFPTIKEEHNKKLNPIFAFQNPEKVCVKFKWLTGASIFVIFNLWLYKSSTIEFEKSDYQKGSGKIGIKSKGIY